MTKEEIIWLATEIVDALNDSGDFDGTPSNNAYTVVERVLTENLGENRVDETPAMRGTWDLLDAISIRKEETK